MVSPFSFATFIEIYIKFIFQFFPSLATFFSQKHMYVTCLTNRRGKNYLTKDSIMICISCDIKLLFRTATVILYWVLLLLYDVLIANITLLKASFAGKILRYIRVYIYSFGNQELLFQHFKNILYPKNCKTFKILWTL